MIASRIPKDNLFDVMMGVLDNVTLLARDLDDWGLNPHLQPPTTLAWWIGVVVIPVLAVLGTSFNVYTIINPPYPYRLPKLLSSIDILFVCVLCWNTTPSTLQLYTPLYIKSTVYTIPVQEGLYALSVYLLLVLTAIRFLRLVEGYDYAYRNLVVCSVMISLTLLVPKFFTMVSQELPRSEISSIMNLTDSGTAKETNVVLDTNLTEDGMNVVLRTTDLQHDFAFRNLFYLLYRQIILQIVPVFILSVILTTTIKRSFMACILPKSKKYRMDKMPALLAILFLACNTGEFVILLMINLLETPPPPFYSVSKLLLSFMCACKPLIYLLDREDKTEKRPAYSWWTEIVTASYN